ncbi:hypothetical protein H4Q26_004929 [Puccinia striiformis f. sp. tritici PST-130]|nr:hypothetical protein H4Q26_004929 [Puccinia striiformis f. sp. tritici PST-130]
MYGNELSFEDKNSFRVLILKTRLQQAHINPNTSSTLLIYWVSSEVISRDGILGLWRGTSPTTIRNVPGIAVYLFGLAQLRTSMTTLQIFTQPALLDQSKILPSLTSTGDFIAVVKTRFESNLYKYKSIREAFQLTLEQQGIQGLWRGFIPTVMRDAPFAGIFISIHEASKRLLNRPDWPYPALLQTTTIISVTISAVLATLITAPFDLIKTDLQFRSSSNVGNFLITASVKGILNGNLLNCFVLFEGSGLRLLRKSLSSAIGWTLYGGLIKKWAIKT